MQGPELERVIAGTLSPEAPLRQAAEAKLEELASIAGFAQALTCVLQRNTAAVDLQLMAALLLKKHIKAHWDAISDHISDANSNSNSTRMVLCEDDKRAVKHALPALLIRGGHSKLETSICMVVSTIAKLEFPEKWPELFPILTKLLASSEPVRTQAGVKCLAMMAEHWNSVHIEHISQKIFPPLQRIIQNSSTFEISLRARAVSVVRACLCMLAVLHQGSSNSVSASSPFPQTVEVWMPVFTALLTETNGSQGLNPNFSLKIEVVRTLSALVCEHPKVLVPLLSSVLPNIWTLLSSGLPLYERTCVSGEDSVYTADSCGDDGEPVGLSALVIQIFELVACSLPVATKRTRKLLFSALPDLSYIVIGYMQLTQDQLEMWQADPNQYVAEEDDDSLEYNVRNSACQLLAEVEMSLGKKAVTVVAQIAMRRLEQCSAAEREWKLQEAALLCIGTVSTGIVQAGKNGSELLPLNAVAFLAQLLNALRSSNNVYVQARSLWCATRLCELLPANDQSGAAFLHASVAALDCKQNIALRLVACRAVGVFSRIESPLSVLVRQQAPTILNRLEQLCTETSEETVHFVLETFLPVLKLDEVVTQNAAQTLVPLAVSLWIEYVRDPLVTEFVLDIFKVFLNLPICHELLLSQLVPVISTQLKNHQHAQPELSGMLESSIELLYVLVHRVGIASGVKDGGVPSTLFTTAFEPLIMVMMTTDDNSIFQAGSTCLRSFVKHAPTQTASFTLHSNGVNGLECVMNVAAKMLQADLTDAAVMNVGALVTQIVQEYASQLPQQTLRNMLSAVVHRMARAEMTSLIQAFCLVFARLVHSHGSVVLDVLESIPVPEHGSNALQFVLCTWLHWQVEFYGSYAVKVTISALLKIMMMRDSRVEQLEIRGDKIEATAGTARIRTRSQRKNDEEKFAQVSFLERMLSILVRLLPELEGEEEDELVSSEEDSDSDSDDDDNDDDDRFHQVGQGNGCPFAPQDQHSTQLSDMLDDEYLDDEDDVQDLDAESDPLFSMDLEAAVLDAIRTLGSDQSMIKALFERLSSADQDLARLALDKARR